jgi:hypothetical protein
MAHLGQTDVNIIPKRAGKYKPEDKSVKKMMDWSKKPESTINET